MRLIFLSLACGIILVSCSQRTPGNEENRQNPELQSPEHLNAKLYLRNLFARSAPELKPGDRVVLVADGSFDAAVTDLIRQVTSESNLAFDAILLQGVGNETDPAQLQLQLWCVDPREMWPAWVWKSLEGASAVVSAYGPDVHNMTPADRHWFKDNEIARVRFWHATMETVLVDALEQGIGFPAEILTALRAASDDDLRDAVSVRITDPNGTDLRFSANKEGRIYADASGVVVAYAMHGGRIPKTVLHIETGKITRVEGEGALADQIRWILANMDDLTFPTAPGPGGSFLVEADLDRIHPKISRPTWEGLTGAAKYFAFSKGYKRAGVLTIGFGTPTAADGEAVLAFAKEHGVTIQHLDTHLYHATVVIDGRTVIDNGRPSAFDDPDVRKVAAKYGDPDKILQIDWSPDLTAR